MNDLIKELYQEIILDHGQSPRNFGECDPHNKSADGHNPLCGDNLKLTFYINNEDVIEDIKFTGGRVRDISCFSIINDRKIKRKKN